MSGVGNILVGIRQTIFFCRGVMKVQLLSLLFVLLKCTDCLAVSYSHQIMFSGEVVSGGADPGWEAAYGSAQPGSVFTGSLLYSFSENTQSVNPGLPNVYDPHSTIDLFITYSLSFDTFSVSSQNQCWLVLGKDAGHDTFFLGDGSPLLNPSYLPDSIGDVTIELYDYSRTSINAAFGLPSLENYSGGRITIGPAMLPTLNVIGQINEIKSVYPLPEPTTMFLFGVGLTGLAFLGRKRRS